MWVYVEVVGRCKGGAVGRVRSLEGVWKVAGREMWTDNTIHLDPSFGLHFMTNAESHVHTSTH